VADEAIGDFRRGVILRYVTREPNLRVKRSCTGLGNLEVFLFVSLSRRTMFSDGLFLSGLGTHVVRPLGTATEEEG
jgi:hypothetical protein